MENQIEKLDKPLQAYAERVQQWVKRGDAFHEEQLLDLGNFIHFAQRKNKVMKIYRRLSIIRTKSMIHDLASQQSAVLHMQSEWQQELAIIEKTLNPLMEFHNKFVTAMPHLDFRVRKNVVDFCVDKLHFFPKIQALCDRIQ